MAKPTVAGACARAVWLVNPQSARVFPSSKTVSSLYSLWHRGGERERERERERKNERKNTRILFDEYFRRKYRKQSKVVTAAGEDYLCSSGEYFKIPSTIFLSSKTDVFSFASVKMVHFFLLIIKNTSIVVASPQTPVRWVFFLLYSRALISKLSQFKLSLSVGGIESWNKIVVIHLRQSIKTKHFSSSEIERNKIGYKQSFQQNERSVI